MQGSEAGVVARSGAGRGGDMAPPDCVAVVNRTAGSASGGLTVDDLTERFAARGLRCRVHLCEDGAALTESVERALGEGVATLVAGGGDGTISGVASLVAGTGVRLGVLPLGTLNHFARDLAIPLDIDGALDVIAGGFTKQIDVAEVNGQTFINNASIGVYPLLVRIREAHQEQGRGKWAAFARAAVRVVRRYPIVRVRLALGDRVVVRRTPMVFVGNNDYRLEGFALTRRERLDAGHLCIAVTRDVGRLGFLWLLVRTVFGNVQEAAAVDVYQETEIAVETGSRSISVAADGEVMSMRTPLRFTVRPGALRTIVPRTDGVDHTVPEEQPEEARS